MKTYKINVTRRDILRGEARSCYRCPVAMAMVRALKRKVTVGNFSWHFRGNNNDCNLPLKVSRFICRFDDNDPVKPFSFVLRVK